MLPFCDRSVTVARKNVAPVWTRSWPIAKVPSTLGQHLKKKRFLADERQKEAALKMGVSNRTLSLWETDRVYPARAFQPRLIIYLGFDPFNDPALKPPKGNETSCVAFLSPEAPATIGQKNTAIPVQIPENTEAIGGRMGCQHQDAVGVGDRSLPAKCQLPDSYGRV